MIKMRECCGGVMVRQVIRVMASLTPTRALLYKTLRNFLHRITSVQFGISKSLEVNRHMT